MFDFEWLDYQLFGGEGGGAGSAGGDGAASAGDGGAAEAGATSDDAGRRQTLESLGVPAAILDRRAKRKNPSAAKETSGSLEGIAYRTDEPTAPAQDTKTAEEQEPKQETTAPKRMTWDEIMADPEYNKAMQETMQKRLKNHKEREEKISPMLEMLAEQYGIEFDPENPDVDGIVNAVTGDTNRYEQKALDMGIPVETVMKLDQLERQNAKAQRDQQKALQDQMIQQHLQKLVQQGEAFKQQVPNFDVLNELRTNPEFARMTSPQGGLSVEQAFYALHHGEIMAAQQQQKAMAVQMASQQAQQAAAATIAAGQRRPDEGFTAQGASVSAFNYKNASPAQRAQLKDEIRRAAAEGRKIYPNG